MIASDVMVSDVITVGPGTAVEEVANILLVNRISAVPVVDDAGSLIGIVSEGDLIHRVEAGTEKKYSWWLKLFSERRTLARDFLKSHAVKAMDVMTKPVIIARPDTPLAELASMLERHRIKRVPIVANGKLVGIVSRANLLQALAALHRRVSVETRVGDPVLRESVLEGIRANLMAGYSHINVIVYQGNVELWGEVGSSEEKDALRVAAELTPGVRSVSNYLMVGQTPHGI